MVYSLCRKVTYVVRSLRFTGHVGVALKLRQKQCGCGIQGLSSHSEETKRVRFLEFLVS